MTMAIAISPPPFAGHGAPAKEGLADAAGSVAAWCDALAGAGEAVARMKVGACPGRCTHAAGAPPRAQEADGKPAADEATGESAAAPVPGTPAEPAGAQGAIRDGLGPAQIAPEKTAAPGPFEAGQAMPSPEVDAPQDNPPESLASPRQGDPSAVIGKSPEGLPRPASPGAGHVPDQRPSPVSERSGIALASDTPAAGPADRTEYVAAPSRAPGSAGSPAPPSGQSDGGASVVNMPAGALHGPGLSVESGGLSVVPAVWAEGEMRVSITVAAPVKAAPPGGSADAGRGIAQVRQVTAALAPPPADGRIEVTLDPVELGRVRLSLTPADQAMTVVLTADRAETLDLMRRHADALNEALRGLGYDSVSLEFADSGARGGQGVPTPPSASGATVQNDTPCDESTGQTAPSAPRMRAGGLDLRF